jgi:hypothetical protein
MGSLLYRSDNKIDGQGFREDLIPPPQTCEAYPASLDGDMNQSMLHNPALECDHSGGYQNERQQNPA